MVEVRLNLGCSDRHLDGFVNVDIAPPADQIVDLAGPWPWPDSSVEEVMALDVCEHIGDMRGDVIISGKGQVEMNMQAALDSLKAFTAKRHPLGRIHFMNELHRVLKPGARATIETPNASRGCGYYQDPSHVSPWCLSTFKYFEHGAFAHTRLAKSYGITAAFRILSLEECATSGEFSPMQPATTEMRLGVWRPAWPEVAWKIKAVLETVK
jgi:hypothetical protein